MAARAALLFSSMVCSSPSLPLGKHPRPAVCKPKPVLEPFVFVDDNTEGWTVVRRRRWSPASDAKAHDLRKTEVSKNHVVGLVRSRACANSRVTSSDPIRMRQSAAHAVRSDGDRGPRIVNIGDTAAGHAF
jgi:hypothetical protein